MKRIFGFDLGTTSVGFAVVDLDALLNPRAGRIERLGVRIFPEGVEPNLRPLDAEERAAVLAELERRPHLTFGQTRRLLRPLWRARDEPLDKRFNFEVMVGGARLDKTQIPGNLIEAKLVSVLDDAWPSHPQRDQIRRQIFDRLYAIHYRRVGENRIEIRSEDDESAARQRFVDEARADYGLAEADALALAEWQPPVGWLRFSTRAVEKLIPRLELGNVLSDAIDAAYPGDRAPSDHRRDRLPSDARVMPDLRNPTVARTLTELRKVTNDLLAVHGRPDLIRIELARDLKLPKRVKDELDKRNNARNRQRKRAEQELQSNGFAQPSRDDIEKWLLWQECKETCPYTGRKIAFGALFGAEPEFEVEHILPRSRSFDNGFANKTISEIAFNRNKGNRTPFEVFGHDRERWAWFQNHLARLGEREDHGRGLPDVKIRRLLRQDYGDTDDDEFVARQLNDTAYIATAARSFLGQLHVPVEACNGRVTAQLRDVWRLNRILKPEGRGKSRADHRHHAVDALAVALTAPALVKRLSDFYARERQGERPRLDVPWPGLWAEAKGAVERIVVSHRVLRKVSGALHEETALGDTGEQEVNDGKTYRLFVKRVDLKGISGKQIESIRDLAIRALVEEHVAGHGGDPKKAFPPYPRLLPQVRETTSAGLAEHAAAPLRSVGRKAGSTQRSARSVSW